jgi:putative ABC transport system permease protein
MKKNAAERALRYPLIIGPSSSSGVQLVLNSIFHIDKPSGTIPFSVYEKVLKDRRTLYAFPLAVADSVRGTPIIGTNVEYLKSFGVTCEAGSIDLSRLECAVLGSAAAFRTGLHVGDTFKGSHGMEGDSEAHEHAQVTYVVRGILSPTNGPEDAAVYINYTTVWAVHKDADHDEDTHHGKGHDHLDVDEGKLTAVIAKTRNPAFTTQLEREYSAGDNVQAVDSGRTVRQLVGYLNKAETVLEIFSILALFVVAMMIFVTIVMSLDERRHELALMRSIGIGKGFISILVMIETLVLCASGTLLGVILSHSALFAGKHFFDALVGASIDPFVVSSLEWNGIIITLASGQILALFSMIRVYRMNLIEEAAKN